MSAPSTKEYMRCAVQSLEQALVGLCTEIRSYPTPISGCDAQFNHLLARRARISAALRELR